jgi:hypothetical protein
MSAQDSHLSMPSTGKPQETDGVKQHHRAALGIKINGETKPYGSEGKTPNLIGNNQGKTY